MSEKFNLVLELFYIPVGSVVKRPFDFKEYRVHDSISINDENLKDIKSVSPSKDSIFLVPLNGSSTIISVNKKEKFLLSNLSKDEAISLINRIDNEFIF